MTTEALPLLEHLAGRVAVDVPDKRWVDAVSEQFLQSCRQGAHDLRSNGQHVVLLWPQPARGVLEQHAEARALGAVGAAAVPEAAEDEQNGPGRDRGGDGLVWGDGSPGRRSVHRWLPGTTRVAPLASVKSSSAHIELSTPSGCGRGSG